MSPSFRHLRATSLLLISCAAALLVACSQPESLPIRIGMVNWPGYEYLYLAQEKGFFRDQGLNIRLVDMAALADSRRAFERGQIDGIACTTLEVLQIYENSRRSPKIVSVIDASEGADVVLAQPDIKHLAELRHKRIGVELGTIGVYTLARALEKAALKITDVELVSASQQSMGEMFQRRTIDAITTFPPTSVALTSADKAVQLFSSAEIPGEIIDVLAFDAGFLQKNSAAVTKILHAFQQALDYAAAHPDDANSIMGRHENISAEEFKAGLDSGIRLLHRRDQAAYLGSSNQLLRILKTTDQVMRETQQLKGASHAEHAIDPRFSVATVP